MTGGLKFLERDIIEYRRESTRIKHVAAEYLRLSDAEKTKTLILAGTNRERELLTDSIRAGLRAEGKLGASAILKTLEPKDLTREELLVTAKLAPGDVLAFHKSFPRQGIRKGEQVEIVSVNHAERVITTRRQSGERLDVFPSKTPGFKAFTVKDREFATFDKVRWTQNDKILGLRNGQDLLVEQISKDSITLTTKAGKRVELSTEARLQLDHSYVNTVYSSQGKTAERVLISTDKTFGKEAMYVAVTRAKSGVTLYTEDKERMLGFANISRAKVSAVELVPEQSHQQAIVRSHRHSMGR